MRVNFKRFFQEYGGSFRLTNLQNSYRKIPVPEPSPIIGEQKLGEGFIQLCPWEGEYLFAVARCARLGIVEIGRFLGGSTFLLAHAAPKGVPIYSIDLAPQEDERLRRVFTASGKKLTKIHLIVGDSQKGRFPEIGPYDLLFIDGDHSYEGCSADIANWYRGLARNGHMLFHDSHKQGVQDAIADFIAAHPKLQVLVNPSSTACMRGQAMSGFSHEEQPTILWHRQCVILSRLQVWAELRGLFSDEIPKATTTSLP